MWILLLSLLTQLLFADESVFRARLLEDPGTLDWNWGETKSEILYQLMEGLFRTDQKGLPVAGVAKEWEWNKHRNELHVKLRPGLKWSDGKELCAADFVRSWQRLKDRKFASPYAHYANPLQSFSAKGCHELRIRTPRYTPELPALLANWVFFPLRAEHLNKKAEVFHTGKDLLVNGPYRIKEWVKEQRLVLEKNPNYVPSETTTAPKIDRIEFLFIPEDATALALYEQKKLDWVRDVPPLMRSPKFKESGELRYFPTLIAFYFGLNASKSTLLQDEDVRHALSMALAREELPKVLGDEVRPLFRWLPDEVMERKNGVAPKVDAELLGRVKKILADAETNGKMDLRLRVYTKPIHKSLSEWAQDQWFKKLGVRIPIDVEEEKVYWSRIASATPPIFLSGVTAPYNHPRAFLQEFSKASTANWLGWNSDTYDLALNDQKFVRAEDILMDAGVVIPLYTRGTAALVAKDWQGFQINPVGVVYLQSVHK